jgi:hypothetical protein
LKQIQELNDGEAGYVQLSVSNKKKLRCGLPPNLLIPKGGVHRAKKLFLFAFVSPSSTPSTSSWYTNTFTMCRGANSTRPFGYPFDRGFEPENLLKDLKNYKKIEVSSVMLEEDVYSESL